MSRQKTALQIDDLSYNPFAFIALLKQGAGIELGIDPIYSEVRLARKLADALFGVLKELPAEMADQMIGDIMELMSPLTGWELLNKTCALLLWGYAKVDRDVKGECFDSFFKRWVRLAFIMLRHGAVCTLTEEEEASLRKTAAKDPDGCKDYFGMGVDDLFIHLEKARLANGLQTPSQVPSSVPVPPPSEELDSKTIISQIFSLAPPVLPKEAGFEQIVQAVLENYYVAPHPDFAFGRVYSGGISDIQMPLRDLHDCDHVVRTALFTRVFLQLLNEQKVAKPPSVESMSSNEYQQFQELLQLAVLYHDVVAENQPKNQEEIQAALYLLRDRPSQLPDDVFMEVAVALANKNVRDIDGGERAQLREKILSQLPDELIQQVPEKSWKQLQARFFQEESSESPLQRWLRMVIRFGDTVDIVRVTGEAGFDWSFLERPECYHQHPDLERQLRSVVKACWNLSAMTGGAGHDSQYAMEYRLREPHMTYEYSGNFFYTPDRNRKHNEVVRRSICAKGNVWDGVRSELLRMAKRRVAYMANMKTATKEDAIYSCQARYHCIYDERDLDQITLPENLTELELLWLSLRDIDWLSGSDTTNTEVFTSEHSDGGPSAKRRKLGRSGGSSTAGDRAWLPGKVITDVKETVNNLRDTGVMHPLGTLSQETLRMTENTGAILHSRGLETWVDHKEIAGTPVEILRTRPIVSAPVKQV